MPVVAIATGFLVNQIVVAASGSVLFVGFGLQLYVEKKSVGRGSICGVRSFTNHVMLFAAISLLIRAPGRSEVGGERRVCVDCASSPQPLDPPALSYLQRMKIRSKSEAVAATCFNLVPFLFL